MADQVAVWEGLEQAAVGLRGSGGITTVHLLKTAIVPDEDTVLADLEEADFDGYAPQAIPGWTNSHIALPPPYNVADKQTSDTVTFAAFDQDGTYVIYGLYLTDADGALLGVDLSNDNWPQTIPAGDQDISLNVATFTLNFVEVTPGGGCDPELMLDLDGDSLFGTPDGDPVPSWPDICDCPRAVLQYTGANQPTFEEGTDILHSRVRFVPDQWMITSLAYPFQDFTIMVVFRSDGLSAYERMVDSDYIQSFWLGRNASVADSWGGGIIDGAGTSRQFATLTDGDWHSLIMRRAGTTYSLFADGAFVSDMTVSGDPLWPQQVYLARSFVYAGYFEGAIGILRIWRIALTDEQCIEQMTEAASIYNTGLSGGGVGGNGSVEPPIGT